MESVVWWVTVSGVSGWVRTRICIRARVYRRACNVRQFLEGPDLHLEVRLVDDGGDARVDAVDLKRRRRDFIVTKILRFRMEKVRSSWVE